MPPEQSTIVPNVKGVVPRRSLASVSLCVCGNILRHPVDKHKGVRPETLRGSPSVSSSSPKSFVRPFRHRAAAPDLCHNLPTPPSLLIPSPSPSAPSHLRLLFPLHSSLPSFSPPLSPLLILSRWFPYGFWDWGQQAKRTLQYPMLITGYKNTRIREKKNNRQNY